MTPKQITAESDLTALQRWRANDPSRTYEWMAKKLGCSKAGISRIVRGVNMPRAQLALDIVELTRGEVTLSDMAIAKARSTPSNRAERVRYGKELIQRGAAILSAASKEQER